MHNSPPCMHIRTTYFVDTSYTPYTHSVLELSDSRALGRISDLETGSIATESDRGGLAPRCEDLLDMYSVVRTL